MTPAASFTGIRWRRRWRPCTRGKELRVTRTRDDQGYSRGHGFFDELTIPILENTAHEEELEPSVHGVSDSGFLKRGRCLVTASRDLHVGIEDWSEAKRHAECFDWISGRGGATQ